MEDMLLLVRLDTPELTAWISGRHHNSLGELQGVPA